MKVKELIEKLKQCSENANVVFLNIDSDIEEITLVEEDRVLDGDENKIPRVVIS